MMERKIEQLLHGYRRGHEQLASSIKLKARDADLITRLSDLSGSLAGAPKFSSYLTAYPLPSETYFALGRTWPDPDASRSGCVLTHTLLVPIRLWSTLAEPRALDDLFIQPTSRSTREYESPILIPERSISEPTRLRDIDHSTLLTFVSRYFGEGRTPVVWFGYEHPEEMLWRLLRGLWPHLRATFSACTFCLQPRHLDDRPFELMFAPPRVYPRFQKLRSEHFIDSTASLSIDKRSDKVDAWCTTLEKQLFEPSSLRKPLIDLDLWAELDEDPTAIRRLFLIQEIKEEKSCAPQVFVGAMDLVESLAKDQGSALASKRRFARLAVQAARETTDPADGLESLRLIEVRLRRTSYLRVQREIGPELLDAVAMLTRKFPAIAAEDLTLTTFELELQRSWLGQGLIQGFRELADDEPEKLLVLRNVPELLRHFLVADPHLGAKFFRAASEHRSDRSMREDLLRLLKPISDPGLRSIFRKSLLPELGTDDADIMAELLKDLRAEEVADTLNILWIRTNQFESDSISKLVIEQVAHGHPVETREWTSQLSWSAPIIAKIFAATYPPTLQGLLQLLDVREESTKKAEAVAAFIQALGPSPLPYWLTNVASKESLLLTTLLDIDASPLPIVTEQTQRLLRHLPSIPIAQYPLLTRQVLASYQRPFFGTLRDLAVRSLISSYALGAASELMIRAFQEHESILPWFRTVELGDLRLLLIPGGSYSPYLINAWRWIAIAPDIFYASHPTFFLDLINMLSQLRNPNWSSQISDTWSQILRRTRSHSNIQKAHIALCVQALKFSFSNIQLPLGSLVAEAFHDVYASVTASTFTSETAPLFSIFDWDKGKQLRHELVDCFLRSKWPPGDLALAAGEVGLLRKVFKRVIRKQGGENYARASLADLKERSDQNSAILARALQGMLAHPDFYEEWD